MRTNASTFTLGRLERPGADVSQVAVLFVLAVFAFAATLALATFVLKSKGLSSQNEVAAPVDVRLAA